MIAILKISAVIFGVVASCMSYGAITIEVQEVGNDVVATASGTVDTDGLVSMVCGVPPCLDGISGINGASVEGLITGTSFIADSSLIRVGVNPSRASAFQVNVFDNGITQVFSDGNFFPPDLSSGDSIGVLAGTAPFSQAIWVPENYVSNSALSGTSTWSNSTLADLGLIPGTYLFSFGGPGNTDTLTLTIGTGGPTFGGSLGGGPSFDGVDLSDGPIFLNEIIELAGKERDLDSLVSTINFQTFEFASDNTGRLSRLVFLDRGIAAPEFSWTLTGSGDTEALILDFSGSADNVLSTFVPLPFPLNASNPALQELVAKFGQQTVDQLLLVDPNLFSTGQLEVRETLQTITILRETPGVWSVTTEFVETLIVPQSVINGVPGGWQGDTTPSSAVQDREALAEWRRYTGTGFTNFSDSDFDGSWGLPVFLDDPVSAPTPPSNRAQQFFSEKVDFSADGTALGTYSGISFDWVLDGEVLTLTSGTEVFEYRLLAQNNGVALLSLTYSSASDPSGFLIAAQGGQFQASGVTRAENLPVPLPFYYQTFINGRPSVENGTLVCEGLEGFFFTDAGGARQLFGCGSVGDDIFLNPEASFAVNGVEASFVRGSAFSQQRRFWQIVSENSAGLIVAIERFEFATDVNNNGLLEDSEFREAASPRLIVLERLDLSDVGDDWNTLDIDNDGLDNLAEEMQGTSFTTADSDGDSVDDGADSCQGTPSGAPVDGDGCSQPQLAVQPPNGDPIFFESGAAVAVRNAIGPGGTDVSNALLLGTAATDSGLPATETFDITRIFTAPDPTIGARSLSFTARGSSTVEPGFMYRSAIEVTVDDGFLDAANPYVNPDGSVNSIGVPDTFEATTSGVLQETVTVTGDPALAAIVLELTIDGTWMRTPGGLNINGTTNLTTVVQQDGGGNQLIYSSESLGAISDIVQTNPIPIVGGQATVDLRIEQSAFLRLLGINGVVPPDLSVTGDFLQTISVTAVRGVNSSSAPVALSSVSTSSGASLPFSVGPVTPQQPAEPVPLPQWSSWLLAALMMVCYFLWRTQWWNMKVQQSRRIPGPV